MGKMFFCFCLSASRTSFDDCNKGDKKHAAQSRTAAESAAAPRGAVHDQPLDTRPSSHMVQPYSGQAPACHGAQEAQIKPVAFLAFSIDKPSERSGDLGSARCDYPVSSSQNQPEVPPTTHLVPSPCIGTNGSSTGVALSLSAQQDALPTPSPVAPAAATEAYARAHHHVTPVTARSNCVDNDSATTAAVTGTADSPAVLQSAAGVDPSITGQRSSSVGSGGSRSERHASADCSEGYDGSRDDKANAQDAEEREEGDVTRELPGELHPEPIPIRQQLPGFSTPFPPVTEDGGPLLDPSTFNHHASLACRPGSINRLSVSARRLLARRLQEYAAVQRPAHSRPCGRGDSGPLSPAKSPWLSSAAAAAAAAAARVTQPTVTGDVVSPRSGCSRQRLLTRQRTPYALRRMTGSGAVGGFSCGGGRGVDFLEAPPSTSSPGFGFVASTTSQSTDLVAAATAAAAAASNRAAMPPRGPPRLRAAGRLLSLQQRLSEPEQQLDDGDVPSRFSGSAWPPVAAPPVRTGAQPQKQQGPAGFLDSRHPRFVVDRGDPAELTSPHTQDPALLMRQQTPYPLVYGTRNWFTGDSCDGAVDTARYSVYGGAASIDEAPTAGGLTETPSRELPEKGPGGGRSAAVFGDGFGGNFGSVVGGGGFGFLRPTDSGQARAAGDSVDPLPPPMHSRSRPWSRGGGYMMGGPLLPCYPPHLRVLRVQPSLSKSRRPSVNLLGPNPDGFDSSTCHNPDISITPTTNNNNNDNSASGLLPIVLRTSTSGFGLAGGNTPTRRGRRRNLTGNEQLGWEVSMVLRGTRAAEQPLPAPFGMTPCGGTPTYADLSLGLRQAPQPPSHDLTGSASVRIAQREEGSYGTQGATAPYAPSLSPSPPLPSDLPVPEELLQQLAQSGEGSLTAPTMQGGFRPGLCSSAGPGFPFRHHRPLACQYGKHQSSLWSQVGSVIAGGGASGGLRTGSPLRGSGWAPGSSASYSNLRMAESVDDAPSTFAAPSPRPLSPLASPRAPPRCMRPPLWPRCHERMRASRKALGDGCGLGYDDLAVCDSFAAVAPSRDSSQCGSATKGTCPAPDNALGRQAAYYTEHGWRPGTRATLSSDGRGALSLPLAPSGTNKPVLGAGLAGRRSWRSATRPASVNHLRGLDEDNVDGGGGRGACSAFPPASYNGFTFQPVSYEGSASAFHPASYAASAGLASRSSRRVLRHTGSVRSTAPTEDDSAESLAKVGLEQQQGRGGKGLEGVEVAGAAALEYRCGAESQGPQGEKGLSPYRGLAVGDCGIELHGVELDKDEEAAEAMGWGPGAAAPDAGADHSAGQEGYGQGPWRGGASWQGCQFAEGLARGRFPTAGGMVPEGYPPRAGGAAAGAGVGGGTLSLRHVLLGESGKAALMLASGGGSSRLARCT